MDITVFDVPRDLGLMTQNKLNTPFFAERVITSISVKKKRLD